MADYNRMRCEGKVGVVTGCLGALYLIHLLVRANRRTRA